MTKQKFSIFKAKQKENKKIFYFLNCPVSSKKITSDGYKIKILGIPVYQCISAVPSQNITLHIQNLAHLCYRYSYLPSIISKHHQKNLVPFKNIHQDKDIVICGTGPTYNYYTPLSAIHIGLNRAYEKEDIHFDYIFAWDLPNLLKNDDSYYEKVKKYPAQKIFGRFMCEDIPQINDQIAEDMGAITLYSSAQHGLLPNPYDETIHYDIENYPLMDFGSCAFGAFHFALYTGAKKIYLVGLDNSLNGYFKKTHKQDFLQTDLIYSGWLKVKRFLEIYYPHVEIVSINPVGLKGIFRDVYTRSYLKDHPEIDKEKVEII